MRNNLLPRQMSALSQYVVNKVKLVRKKECAKILVCIVCEKIVHNNLVSNELVRKTWCAKISAHSM